MPLEVYDDEFAEIIGKQPQLIRLANGFGFTEGPVYLQVKNSDAGYLVFTDQINDNINLIRWHGLTPYNTITPGCRIDDRLLPTRLGPRRLRARAPAGVGFRLFTAPR